MPNTERFSKFSPQLYALLFVGLVAYLLPWIVAPSAPMTLNAYDLAEWVSLYPPQKQTLPPLLVPLLLRAQLLIFAIMLGIIASGKIQIIVATLIIAALAIGQMPPFEFFSDLDNLNYQQQSILAGISLVAGLALIPVKLKSALPLVLILLSIFAIATSVYAQAQAQTIYRELGQMGDTGFGLWLLILSHIGIAMGALWSLARVRGANEIRQP